MKKILSAGIILLSATNFVTPVMAQSGETTLPTLASATQYGEVDNSKNPMNTALGTVESQYPTVPLNTNSGVTLSNSGTLNNAQRSYFSSQIGQQAWKNFHCAMLAKGITWQAPTNMFANNAICGTNVVGGSLSISNPQLEYQRQLVRDYIARLSGGNVVKTENTVAENSQKNDFSNISETVKLLLEIDEFKKQNEEKDEKVYTKITELMKEEKRFEMNQLRLTHFKEENQGLYNILKDKIDYIPDYMLRQMYVESNKTFDIYLSLTRIDIEQMMEKGEIPLYKMLDEKYKNIPENEIFVLDGLGETFDFVLEAGKKADKFDEFHIYKPHTKINSLSNGFYDITLVNAPNWLQLNKERSVLDAYGYNGTDKVGTRYEFQIVVSPKDSNKKPFIQNATITMIPDNEYYTNYFWAYQKNLVNK